MRRPSPIEERAFGRRERFPARLAFVPLAARFGLAVFDDIALLFILALAILSTVRIWTPVTNLSKLRHSLLLIASVCSSLLYFLSTLKRDTIRKLDHELIEKLFKSGTKINEVELFQERIGKSSVGQVLLKLLR